MVAEFCALRVALDRRSKTFGRFNSEGWQTFLLQSKVQSYDTARITQATRGKDAGVQTGLIVPGWGVALDYSVCQYSERHIADRCRGQVEARSRREGSPRRRGT